ncbi:MAG: prepilin-type N-terminal cleavage/methylation domain-containing protein [Gammaproteobacteria bacterium]|nr:prepilin-type N-terminal cleavage/methylation domain-containing protein [Gammaproteobacteria bacterium]
MTQQQYNMAGGFTLIELIVTLAIGGIVMSIGVPSFIGMTRDNRLISQTNELVANINLARSEAVKRGVRVVLCRSADPSASPPSCGGNANTWTTGWIVFADANNTGAYVAADDTLIRVGQPADSALTVITNAVSNNNLEYNADGTTNEGGGTALFVLCDTRGASQGRQIQVNAMGRPRLVKGSDATLNCATPIQI